MRTTLQEFRKRVEITQNVGHSETKNRLAGLYEWMINTKEVKEIMDTLTMKNEIINSDALIKIPSTPDEVGTFGILLLKKISDGSEFLALSRHYNILPPSGAKSFQDFADTIIDRYIEPTLELIDEELKNLESESESIFQLDQQDTNSKYPLEIHESLQKFLRDNPQTDRNAFVMMRFSDTKAHSSIFNSIKSVLGKYAINAHRADDKEYHEDLFPNVLTYIHGCRFGIAVFERLVDEEFNPNVSLEVGYLRALRKPICLLKDKTLKTLQTDLVGKLYRSFDPQDPENTIPKELNNWLRDKEIIN